MVVGGEVARQSRDILVREMVIFAPREVTLNPISMALTLKRAYRVI